MPFRRSPPARRVEFLHDGELLAAESGESLACALLANDRLVLSRSPKLHRPRGPYCLRAACDGCLVRVNGQPNVFSCRTRVHGGETVETQNVLGSRELDLLSATDFLFPHGIDAHRLLAGVPGVSPVVTRLARRIAGLGRLPDEAQLVEAARRRDVPLLVVGGGRSGLTLAAELGELVTLVDDGLTLGGTLGLLEPARTNELEARARAAKAELLTEATAFGVYREDERPSVLVSRAGQVTLFRLKLLALATGCHDAVPSFAGSDLPGVLSARAGLELERAGIVPDERIVLVGKGRSIDALAQRLRDQIVGHVPDPADVARAIGKLRLRALEFRTPAGTRKLRAGALLYAGAPPPAFELAVQAGGRAVFQPDLGYAPDLTPDGLVAPGVYCVGSVSGTRTNTTEAALRAIRRALG